MIEYIEDFEEPLVEGMIKVPGITQRYEMPTDIESTIRKTPYKFGFGAFSAAVYMRTYSRLMANGKKEQFPDTVVRVVKGVISIVKDWKIKHALEWDQEYWNDIALRFGLSMMKMQFLPSGRNLWVQGTEFCYQKGGSCLNNCGFVSTSEGLLKSLTWTMDSLMVGAGCGHDDEVSYEELSRLVIPGCVNCVRNPNSGCLCKKNVYKIHDSREGWVKSLSLLIKSFYDGVSVHFDYSDIRPPNTIIGGFGGTSSGPEPLRILHERVRIFFTCYIYINNMKAMTPYDAIVEMTYDHVEIYNNPILKYTKNGVTTEFADNGKMEKFGIEDSLSKLKSMPEELRMKKTYGKSRLVCDLFNAVGACVVAGNVRRSAEISLSTADNEEFKNLKNYTLNPERACIGWMSNNTVKLTKTEDFEHLPSIAERIRDNAEPGILNTINVKKFGRITTREKIGREAEPDEGTGVNPCITGDSMISTSEGPVCVRDLVGKQFTAVNWEFNNIVDSNVNANFKSTEQGFWSNGVKPVYELKVLNGNSVKCTDDHKIYVIDRVGGKNKTCLETGVEMLIDYHWKKLRDLDIDNDLVYVDNDIESQRIISIEYVGKEEVFDCSIPGPQAYFANNIMVHNCGEIPLCSYEYCNLSEWFPTRCDTYSDMEEAVRLGTLYCSIVSLLPTHWIYTNRIVSQNHRIGVSASGIVDEVARTSYSVFTKKLRSLYKLVREVNTDFSKENGVQPAIRVTTGKPSGTLSQLVGCSSGIHFPTYSYCIRRMRQATNLKLTQVLKDAGYPWEYDKYLGEGTTIFSFPLKQDQAREATSVSMWEQASNLQMMQREWGDNSISCTIYFNPKTEGHDLEHLLAHYSPLIKSLSALPHSDEIVYEQAPYERITEEEYYRLSANTKELDFSLLDAVNVEEDAVNEMGCSSGVCEFNANKMASTIVDVEHVEEDAAMEGGCESGFC